jgi:hypothetical protein
MPGVDRSGAARTLTSLWLLGCGQLVGIHSLTTSQANADDGGADVSCDGAASCCAELAPCCPKLDAYPSVEDICASAVDAGVEQECAELLTVYRPECP